MRPTAGGLRDGRCRRLENGTNRRDTRGGTRGNRAKQVGQEEKKERGFISMENSR